MNIKKVSADILEKKQSKISAEIERMLDEFYESGNEVAEVTDWENLYSTIDTCASGIRYQISKFYPNKIAVYRRNKKLYLARIEGKKLVGNPVRADYQKWVSDEEEYAREGGTKDKLLSLEAIEDELNFNFCHAIKGDERCDLDGDSGCPLWEDGTCVYCLVESAMDRLKGGY